MGGWTRLALVLSVIYWALAGPFAWICGHQEGADIPGFGWITLGMAAFVYFGAAAIWWAFAGFARR
jgi:hypothetical protein